MLDPRKIARIIANRDRVRQGRTRTVTLTYRRPAGLVYTTADVVWKEQLYADPTAQRPLDAPTQIIAEFPLTLDPAAVSVVADTPDATAAGVAAARSYEIIAYRQAGIVPDRWLVHLKRLR